MKYLLFLVVFSLSGCSNLIFVSNNFTVEESHRVRTVTWIVVDDISNHCRSLGAPMNAIGCAVVRPATCTVYTGKDTNHAILGHEVRHCFYGNFHD